VSRDGAAPQPLAIAPSPVPFDIDLGTNRSGATYAVYTRCATAGAPAPEGKPTRGTDCDVYRTSIATGVEQRLASLSSPLWDEREPAIFRGEIAFIRTERHRGRTYDVLRTGNTTSGARGTRAHVKVLVRRGSLAHLELGPRHIAYIRSRSPRADFGEQVVHVRTLRGDRDRSVYTARSGGANFANIAGLSLADDLRAFTWARTNQGSGAGNRLVRYRIATRRLSYSQGSSRIVSSAWAGETLGMALMVDASGTGTCSGNVNDPPDDCSVQLTGPVAWNAAP
jgi:hypothetical protein